MQAAFNNPFANCGTIVCGDNFFGRKQFLKMIENRIIQPLEPGNIAIIGLPRIGKSSLVYEALIERSEKLISQKKLAIFMDISTFSKASEMFRSLVETCTNKMEELNWLSEPIREIANQILSYKSTEYDYGIIRKFFKKVKQSGYSIIFILDEFDHARNLFKNNAVCFHQLRDLSDVPEWRVTFVLTSRRSIRDIEVQSSGISNFDGIFSKIYLTMFTKSDLDEYFNRLNSLGFQVSEDVKDRFSFYCGGYPYLLGMLTNEIFDEINQSEVEVDINKAAFNIGQGLVDHYNQIVNLLQEDKKLNKLLQILFGPVYDATQTDVDEFLRYGLIKASEQNEGYSAFSKHFHTFLEIKEREVDIWPLWSQTEKALRNLISIEMTKKYGEDWIEELERRYPNLNEAFKLCRECQSREEKSFGTRASQNLIEFTYPKTLFTIIFSEWDTFRLFLGRDKNYWTQHEQLLAKIRNPLAHNRFEVPYEDMLITAKGFCEEILRTIESSQTNQ